MNNNIFVTLLISALFAVFAASCVPKIEYDSPVGRVVSKPHSENGKINLTLVFNTNLQDYIKVSYVYIGCDRIVTKGDFENRDSLTYSWSADSSYIKLAFLAEKKRSFSAVLFDRPEGITFNVKARVTTPTDGVEINWGGIYGSHDYNDSNSLWRRTLTALNSGLPGETLGTGTYRSILFGIYKNEYGEYGIDVKWKPDSLF